MTFLLSMIGGIWGRIAAIVVGAAGIAAALLGMRWRIRRAAKEELSHEIQARTLDRIREAQGAAADADAVPDGGIRDKLRDMGHLRD